MAEIPIDQSISETQGESVKQCIDNTLFTKTYSIRQTGLSTVQTQNKRRRGV